MFKTSLTYAMSTETTLTGTILTRTTYDMLIETTLSGTILTGTTIIKTTLTYAMLTDKTLSWTTLTKTTLTFTVLIDSLRQHYNNCGKVTWMDNWDKIK